MKFQYIILLWFAFELKLNRMNMQKLNSIKYFLDYRMKKFNIGTLSKNGCFMVLLYRKEQLKFSHFFVTVFLLRSSPELNAINEICSTTNKNDERKDGREGRRRDMFRFNYYLRKTLTTIIYIRIEKSGLWLLDANIIYTYCMHQITL